MESAINDAVLWLLDRRGHQVDATIVLDAGEYQQVLMHVEGRLWHWRDTERAAGRRDQLAELDAQGEIDTVGLFYINNSRLDIDALAADDALRGAEESGRVVAFEGNAVGIALTIQPGVSLHILDRGRP